MIRCKVYLRDKNADKETPLFILFRFDKQVLKYPANISIHPYLWDNKKNAIRHKKNDEISASKSLKLDNLIADVKNAYSRLASALNREPSVEELRNEIDKARGIVNKSLDEMTLLGYVTKFIEDSALRQNERTGKTIAKSTIRTYCQLKRRLELYQTKKCRKVKIEDVDIEFYRDFHKFILDTGLAVNTISKQVMILKMILKDAISNGYNVEIMKNLDKVKVKREKSESIYLNEMEILELYKHDLSENKRLERVRDLFVVGCFTGLRFSDLSRLTSKNIDGDYIEIETQKTRESVSIPLHPIVRLILDKYKGELPRALTNQKANEFLKEIGRAIEALKEKTSKKITKGGQEIHRTYEKWELLTTHTARRSFASNLFVKGIPSQTIMKITGHKTEKSFMEYIKITSRENATIIKKLWDSSPIMEVGYNV